MAVPSTPFDLFGDWYRPAGSLLGARGDAWLPAVDIHRTDDGFEIEVEVPGFQPEQVHVEAHDGVLTVLGERSSSTEDNSGDVIRRERRSGRFVRRFSLPPGIEVDNIDARVRDGVLTVKVPQPRSPEPTRIEVG